MAFANPQQTISQFGLSPGMRVADFGAGAGHYAVAAADIVGDSGEVYVIDIQPELLTKARTLDGRTRSNLHFIRGDLETPGGSSLADSVADVVIISNMLFQVDDKGAIAREAARVLKTPGRAMVIDWTDSFGGLGPVPEAVVPEATARTLFEKAGLVYERSFAAGDQHFGMVMHKKHG